MPSQDSDPRNPPWVAIIVSIITFIIGPVVVYYFTNKNPPTSDDTTSNETRSALEVSIINVASNRTYFTGSLKEGASVYTDRNYVYSNVPSLLKGKAYIITANDDKFRTDTAFLKFSVNQDVIVYVAHSNDYKNKPHWLEAFTPTNIKLTFGVASDVVLLDVYEKRYSSGQVILGGNIPVGETENHAMYTVVVDSANR